MTSGDKAWLGLAGYVLAYDLFAALTGRETLSSAYWRAVQNPWRRWPTIVFWGYLTVHLFHGLPDRYDPFRRFLAEVERSRHGR